MKIIITIFLSLGLLLLIGCSEVKSNKLTEEQITDIKSNMTYFKDNKGICWAMVGTSRTVGTPTGIVGSIVDCKKVEL